MKKIIDIATGNKFVQWGTLAQPIDDNFAELDETKLDKTSVSQSTGASTGTVMSQKAVTDALEKKIGPENLVQSTGNSTTTAMSQKAVTDALETYGANPSYTNYLVCNTADSVAVKTVTLLGFTLSNKVRLLIKMTSANVADNVSLSISSPMLDTKPLYYNGKRASSTNSWIAGAVLDVYYDGTNFMSTDIESSFVPVTGISDLINTGSAMPEDIKRILGTTDYQELKTLYGDKILIESQSTSFNVYGMSGFGNSTLGTIKIESLLSRASNYTHKGYIALSYAVGSLSIIKAGYIQLLEDAPKDGGIYGRKNGKWVKSENSGYTYSKTNFMDMITDDSGTLSGAALQEYNRIKPLLGFSDAIVFGTISTDGPTSTGIASGDNDRITASIAVILNYVEDNESGSNLSYISASWVDYDGSPRSKCIVINHSTLQYIVKSN